MVYVTGFSEKLATVFYYECETLAFVDEISVKFKEMGMIDIDLWAVEPTFENARLIEKYPHFEAIHKIDKIY